MRILFKILRYLIYLTILATAIQNFYYYSITKDAYFVEASEHIYASPELDLRAGYFHHREKKSSFYHFPYKKKSDGTIRVGVFGGSYTWGDSVGQEGDFPTILGKLLGPNYEVLNFGMSWFSLAQAYIYWQHYQDLFGLDIVIYGPRGLWLESNLTFNHTHDYYPSYLRSRFVIKENQLVELPPIGTNRVEAQRNYYSLFPSKQYWVYDLRPPSLLRAISYYTNRNPRNPFYHHHNPEEEHLEIVKKIFHFMAKDSKQLIILSDEPEYQSLLDDVVTRNPNTMALNFSSHLAHGIPFATPDYHSSVFGNARIANLIYKAIIKNNYTYDTKLPVLLSKSQFSPLTKWPPTPIEELSDVKLILNGEEVGRVVPSKNRFENTTKTQSLTLPDTEYLVAITCDNQRVENSLMLALELKDIEKLPRALLKQHRSGKGFFTLNLQSCLFNTNYDILFVTTQSRKPDWISNLFIENQNSPYNHDDHLRALKALFPTYKFGIDPNVPYEYLKFEDQNEMWVEINGRGHVLQ